MKTTFAAILLAFLLMLPDLGAAQSLPRMGGVRANDMYGFGGGGTVYGFRTQRRNLTGIGNQRGMLRWRSFASNSLFGVGRLARTYSMGLSKRGFSRSGNTRRFF